VSQSFRLVCDETKQTLWIGQGHQGRMTCLYSGEPETMEKLQAFLNHTMGKPLRLVCDESPDYYTDFEITTNETTQP
jgi:hypothetical protein